MRILLAPTAYKGSLSPAQVALAMDAGIKKFAPFFLNEKIEVDLLPIADGGDGTIEALALSSGGSIEKTAVVGSCNEAREAIWLKNGEIAVVELASACGIAGLKREQLSPMHAHTRGLGIVIAAALKDNSNRELYIAIGGSASTDGASGALSELGAIFFDETGKPITPAGGGMLQQIKSCDLSKLAKLVHGRSIKIATDVVSPLLGLMGAANVFGPQKGASPEQVQILDANLRHFADVLEAQLKTSARDISGAGAAGGAGFGLSLGLDAEIISGFEWMAGLLDLEKRIEESDLVISGEGRIDSSSLQGKVIGSLTRLCKSYSKPLWLIAGSVALSDAMDLDAELVGAASSGTSFATTNDITEYTFASLKKLRLQSI